MSDAAWEALAAAQVRRDRTPRWRVIRRYRLLNEIERLLAEAEAMEEWRPGGLLVGPHGALTPKGADRVRQFGVERGYFNELTAELERPDFRGRVAELDATVPWPPRERP